MGEEAGDKSEEPTPHKLREARKKGQIAKSKEITTAVLVLVSFWVFKSTAAKDWMELVAYTNAIFTSIPNVPDQFEFANIMDLYMRSLLVMSSKSSRKRMMLPLKSRRRQSFLPVPGDARKPRPHI
jgi:flagellar biosynthesis protein FlhB